MSMLFKILTTTLMIYLVSPISLFRAEAIPGSAISAIRDSVEMRLIESDDFLMGSKSGEGRADERPQRKVYVDKYSIDIYEVTNERYLKFIHDTERKEPPNSYGNTLLSEQPGISQLPVVQVTWYDAVDYCRWTGKRLPTEAEWEKAGRGKRPIKYPWGDSQPDSEKLNYNEEKMKTMAVGSYEKGKSDYGIYDLSGNASEWVHDWHFPEYYLFSPKENPQGPEKGQYKIIRGGNWRNSIEYVDLTYRNATTPRMRNTGVGFRCAKNAS